MLVQLPVNWPWWSLVGELLFFLQPLRKRSVTRAAAHTTSTAVVACWGASLLFAATLEEVCHTCCSTHTCWGASLLFATTSEEVCHTCCSTHGVRCGGRLLGSFSSFCSHFGRGLSHVLQNTNVCAAHVAGCCFHFGLRRGCSHALYACRLPALIPL